MSRLERLGNTFSVLIRHDEDGFIGRECPAPECEGYFKVQPGTGLKGTDLACHCPYCGHVGAHSTFFTKEQIEHAKSVVLNKVTGSLLKDLKELELDHQPPRGGFGIGISMRVEGRPSPIRYYQEQRLETMVICDSCTLRYAIYGVFAFCPDCGRHNSLQILNKNFELAQKEIDLAKQVERDLAEHLIADALENAVSAFDGFGRETCRIHAPKSSDPAKAENLSFQNLARADKHIHDLFGTDLSASVDPKEWDFAWRCFQKRHLLAHKMGVVDEEYVEMTKDPAAVVGRKVTITPEEVVRLIRVLKVIGSYLVGQVSRSKPAF